MIIQLALFVISSVLLCHLLSGNRWEEEKKDGETKWNFLEHKGPVFAEAYIPNPEDVKFYYDGK